MELISEVDLIPLMELIPVVDPIPVIDMIPTIMIPTPTYPHCSMVDSDSDSKKNWNHNTSSAEYCKFLPIQLRPKLRPDNSAEALADSCLG